MCVYSVIIQHATRMRHIVICGLPGSTIVFHMFSQTAWFLGRGWGGVIEHKTCFDILYKNFVWNIYNSKKKSARYYHKCAEVFKQSTSYSCQILTTLEISRQISEKYTNIIFHEYPLGVQVYRQTVMTQIISSSSSSSSYHHQHHRLYSPGWALAFSSKCRQRALSWSSVRKFLS